MSEDSHKKYAERARRGIKGEAFFETLVSDYCIPHQIVGPKDIGIDYFCEWVYDDKPTGLLFGVQVKAFAAESARSIKPLGMLDQNGLDLYEINYSAQLKVKKKTLSYWKGLGIPIYLFAVVEARSDDLDCYYKRYTPLLTSKRQEQDFLYSSGFCKVNNGFKFLAFKHPDKGLLGFARDLYVDYMRCCYSKGIITYLDPKILGLNQFTGKGQEREHIVFEDLFDEYVEEIYDTYIKTQIYLERGKERTPENDESSLYALTTGWGLE